MINNTDTLGRLLLSRGLINPSEYQLSLMRHENRGFCLTSYQAMKGYIKHENEELKGGQFQGLRDDCREHQDQDNDETE